MSHFLVNIDEHEFDIRLEYRSERYFVTLGGREMEVAFHRLSESRALLLIDNHSYEVDVRTNGYDNSRTVFMNGMEIHTTVEDYNLARLRKRAGISGKSTVTKVLKATMPGLVVDVKVKVGDTISKGEPLLIIEAMKMENIIKAASDGVIKGISVDPGTSVNKGDKLLEFE